MLNLTTPLLNHLVLSRHEKNGDAYVEILVQLMEEYRLSEIEISRLIDIPLKERLRVEAKRVKQVDEPVIPFI